VTKEKNAINGRKKSSKDENFYSVKEKNRFFSLKAMSFFNYFYDQCVFKESKNSFLSLVTKS
jgi:hypothetical protein